MMKIYLMSVFFIAITLQIATAKWCTKMGRRAYKEEVNGIETKYITKLEKYCCDGYSLNGTECKPICRQGCPHGVCEEPEKCVCNQGYKLQPFSNVCEPYCSTPCGFGKCIKPDTCECDAGHALDSSSKMCQPVCAPQCTANSKCLRPNQCECNVGYIFNQTTELCNPICYNACINGFCLAPNECQCNKGYSRDLPPTAHICRANYCKKPCYLGYCDADGECHCYDGHTKSLLIMDGNVQCETIAVHAIKLLCIFLSVILVFAILIVIMVKLLVKQGTYKPKKTEDEFNEKIAKQ